MRSIGSTLVFAGVLVLTVGTAPASDGRIQVRTSPSELGVPSERSSGALTRAVTVEQEIPRSARPDRSSQSLGAFWQRENVCVEVGLIVHETEDAVDWNALVSLETTGEGGLRRLLGRSGSSETVPIAPDAIADGRAVACFGMSAARLQAADVVTLRVGVDAPEGDAPFAVELRPRTGEVSSARVATSDRANTLTAAVDYAFIREARSYREIVIGRIGSATLLLGGGILVALAPASRRKAGRGWRALRITSSGTPGD
jgi:hypothetical protein